MFFIKQELITKLVLCCINLSNLSDVSNFHGGDPIDYAFISRMFAGVNA